MPLTVMTAKMAGQLRGAELTYSEAGGFAYGTLPGHPGRGEEAFIIQQHSGGTVSFTIAAFSRPATALAKAAGPAGQAIQRQLTARYLRVLAR